MSISGTALFLSVDKKIGLELIMRQAMARAPEFVQRAMEQVPPEQREAALRVQVKRTRIIGLYFTWFRYLIVGLIAAAVLMVAFNFILEAGVSFNKSLAVVFYGWLPTIIFQLLVMIVLLKGVDPENFNPENPLVTNPASFINSDGVSRFVYRLLSYIDVFAVWEMALMGIGFSTIAAKKISTGTAITTVAFIYGIYVLIRSALSF